MKTLIILGSSNQNGNTFRIAQELQNHISADILDLKTKHIEPFNYEFKNQDDDFNATMHHILDHYDCLIFASPVYWYTMSSIMKTFFDRFTDGLLHDKPLGEKFKGKIMAAVACGSSQEEIDGYFVPFRNSATYLNMDYKGDTHV